MYKAVFFEYFVEYVAEVECSIVLTVRQNCAHESLAQSDRPGQDVHDGLVAGVDLFDLDVVDV